MDHNKKMDFFLQQCAKCVLARKKRLSRKEREDEEEVVVVVASVGGEREGIRIGGKI